MNRSTSSTAASAEADIKALRPADPSAVESALARVATGAADDSDLRLLTKHFLAVLESRAPGRSVEVRVPPYAAVQVIPGVRHTRGTPPAVVEMDAATWIGLATGSLAWAEAKAAGRVRAGGERADLAAYLPLVLPGLGGTGAVS